MMMITKDEFNYLTDVILESVQIEDCRCESPYPSISDKELESLYNYLSEFYSIELLCERCKKPKIDGSCLYCEQIEYDARDMIQDMKRKELEEERE